MAAAILTQGLTATRDALAALVTHIAVTDDSVAFALGQTAVNPTGGTTTVLTKASTAANVNATTVDETITITGATEFTGKVINTIGAAKGTATTGVGTDALSRIVRGAGLGIGVQSGDVYTVGVRLAVSDVS